MLFLSYAFKKLHAFLSSYKLTMILGLPVFSFTSIICQWLFSTNHSTCYYSKMIWKCWWTWAHLTLVQRPACDSDQRESPLGRFHNAVLVKGQSNWTSWQLTDNLPKCPQMSTENFLVTRRDQAVFCICKCTPHLGGPNIFRFKSMINYVAVKFLADAFQDAKFANS